MSSRGGMYIVFEGLDGCGKTTQFDLLLKALGKKALGVREPGGTPMAEHVRALLKDTTIQRSPRANLYLMSACRVELIQSVIAPALNQNKIVVSDRSWLSTYACQGSEGVDKQEILTVSKQATGNYAMPDITILVDAPIRLCQERMAASAKHGNKDYFDTKPRSYFEGMRRNYLEILKTLPNAHIISGVETPEVIHEQILTIVHTYLGIAAAGGQQETNLA